MSDTNVPNDLSVSPPKAAEPALTLLIADDEDFGRQYLSVLAEALGFNVVQAVDGMDAVAKFHAHQADLVVMDVLMPKMDGYAATRLIKAASNDAHVPVIFLTGLNDIDSLTQCLECGGDDFLTKPYNQIILTAKLSAHARARRFSLTLRERNEQLAYFKNRTMREQAVAERVFSKILARGQPALPNVTAHVSPMAIFSGDVYQAASAPSGALFLILGDFTGHGLSAAIGALPVAELFTNMVHAGNDVSTITIELNRRMTEILPPDMFLAAAVLRYDPHRQALNVWLGGLPPPFITDAQGNVVTTLTPQHMPLGILKPHEFDAGVRDYDLPDHGRVVLYSDGVIEATSPTGEAFGEHRLITAVQANSADSAINNVLDALRRFTGQLTQQDDISLIELRQQTPMAHSQ